LSAGTSGVNPAWLSTYRSLSIGSIALYRQSDFGPAAIDARLT
jgi:hypothetical protein